MNNEALKKMIREVVLEVQAERQKELDEITTTGAVAAYQTPNAFQGGSGDAKRKKKIAARSMPGGKVVGEEITDEEVTDDIDVEGGVIRRQLEEARGRYYNFRDSNLMKNHSKVSIGIREAKKILREVEFLVKICERLKLESGIDQSQLWKRSSIDIQEIHNQLKNIARRMKHVQK